MRLVGPQRPTATVEEVWWSRACGGSWRLEVKWDESSKMITSGALMGESDFEAE